MPRRQNLCSIVATLPRNWAMGGFLYGRIVKGRRFQFVFPSEELMEAVLRRGPWAFADRMLVFQMWNPLMNPLIMNYISFWIQIRGIPLQFMNMEVVAHVARAIGQLMEVDYNAKTATRAEFVRVQLN